MSADVLLVGEGLLAGAGSMCQQGLCKLDSFNVPQVAGNTNM